MEKSALTSEHAAGVCLNSCAIDAGCHGIHVHGLLQRRQVARGHGRESSHTGNTLEYM
jgi:hypothetical protein